MEEETKIQRAQLAYPLDPESEGSLKYTLEKILFEIIQRRKKVKIDLNGVTTFAVASDYMVVTGGAAVTILTITGGREGQILSLQFVDANVTITDTSTGAADTINLSAAFTSTAEDILQIMYDGISWREVSRSVN